MRHQIVCFRHLGSEVELCEKFLLWQNQSSTVITHDSTENPEAFKELFSISASNASPVIVVSEGIYVVGFLELVNYFQREGLLLA